MGQPLVSTIIRLYALITQLCCAGSTHTVRRALRIDGKKDYYHLEAGMEEKVENFQDGNTSMESVERKSASQSIKLLNIHGVIRMET
jgi:hypothetical protein